ncbi:MAG: hypothetical protein IJR71_04070 [Prevotella sp.]|nr:hypothetical protein [Prevotella sp.]
MKKVIKSVLAMAIAAFAFTSCEDVPEPYSLPTEGGNETVVVEPTGSGTAADPYNVVAVLDYVNSLGADVESEQNVYIKGKVVSITEEFSTQYGNATYYISDDGTKNNQFYVYRSLYLDNKKFAEGNTQIQEGDEVVVCGKVVNYKGTTPETVQNKSYLYSLNGVGGNGGETPQPAGEATGSGTEADPYNAVAANNLANSLADNAKSDNVFIKGKVVSIKEQFGTQYGNATFYISDDGTEAGQFYVYRALYLGNKKYTAGDLLKEGDEVVIYGKVTKYVNQYGTTLETVQNEAYVYSLNGKSEGGETPQPQGDFGTAEAPITVAQALSFIEGLGDGKTTDAEAYVKGKIKSVTEVSTSYGNATYVISDEGADNELTVFRGYYLGGEKFTAEDQIKVGDEVIVKGKLQKYVKDGNVTPEIATGSSIYSLNGETGGNTPEPQPGGSLGELNGNVLTLTASALGVSNGVAVPTLTLVDGTTITFDGGGNNNVPKYYDNGTSVRMYAKNSFVVKSSKTIVGITLKCTVDGTSKLLCNASESVAAEPGTVSYNDNDVIISDISAGTVTVTNAVADGVTGAAAQVRFATLIITYSE